MSQSPSLGKYPKVHMPIKSYKGPTSPFVKSQSFTGVWAVQHKGLICSLPVYWQLVPGEKKLLLERLSDPSQDFPAMH